MSNDRYAILKDDLKKLQKKYINKICELELKTNKIEHGDNYVDSLNKHIDDILDLKNASSKLNLLIFSLDNH
jgi:hypothetical protein